MVSLNKKTDEETKKGVQSPTDDELVLGGADEVICINEQSGTIDGNRIAYHYDSDMTIGETQLAAKSLYELLTSGIYRNNTYLISCPAPVELGKDWANYRDNDNKSYQYFCIETQNYGCISYELNSNVQLLGLEANLALSNCQNIFKKIREQHNGFELDDVDALVNSFISINSAITTFYIRRDQVIDSFDWNTKYNPCYFDRRRMLDLRGLMMIMENSQMNKGKNYEPFKKILLKNFALNIRFLTFWVSLLDTATFPNLPPSDKEVYSNLTGYILRKFANIYVYEIIIESDPVKETENTNSRGSNCNTTRVKMYYMQDDGYSRLLRLDLPHKDYPFVHINIECKETEENLHIRLSQNESRTGEFDHVFDSLEETLRIYNFYSLHTRHTPVADDRMVFKEMEYWKALYMYNYSAMGFCFFEEETEVDKLPFVEECRLKLIRLLEEDGLAKEDLNYLKPNDLFEFANDVLSRGILKL